MAVVTHAGLNRQLSYEEVDNNFTELDARTAVKWQNLPGEMIADGIANAPPMRLFNSTVYMRAYSADVEQELSVMFHMTKDYLLGTDIYPHGHIVTPTASSGVVRWKIVFSWANEFHIGDPGDPVGDQIYSAPVTMYVEQTITAAHQNAHLLVETGGALSIPTLAPDAMILMRVARDTAHVNDTYPDEIYLSMVDIYYQSQGFGADER